MSKLMHLWRELRASFWFVPSLIIAASIALAVALIQLDSDGSAPWMAHWPRLFGAGAAAARGMLSTIAGSMMTVVGVTFSMTLVTLALASSQYTSRILRKFMSDRVTQVVLGTFAGIFTYCLIVLRTIRGGESAYVPSLAVLCGVVLAIGGISVLIFFIHHIASSIQASNIVSSVTAETIVAVDRLFPIQGDEPAGDDETPLPPELLRGNWQAVPAATTGYIQGVDTRALLDLARKHHAVVRMERGIGEFVVEKTALVSLAMHGAPESETIAALQDAYSVSRYRTVDQDSAFGIRQIVDMALRALSPGINDTTTAVMCVDYLTSVLARVAGRPFPAARRYERGELRLITIGPSFAGLVSESFDQIRASADGNLAIMVRMLGALQTVASLTASPSRRCVLQENVLAIAELADRTIKAPRDRAVFETNLARVSEELNRDSSPARALEASGVRDGAL